MSVTVEISGPGRTMDSIVVAVMKALTDAGVVLTVEDEFPPQGIANPEIPHPVILRVKHLPWEG